MTTTTIEIGDHVQGGQTAEDYDHGEIVEIEGDRALVAWEQSQETTWAPLAILTPYDASRAAETAPQR